MEDRLQKILLQLLVHYYTHTTGNIYNDTSDKTDMECIEEIIALLGLEDVLDG